MNADPVQTVSQLTESIKYTLNDEFVDVVVSGEISGLSRPQSGHIYLTLKDAHAQLSTVVWRSTAARLRFEPQDGMQVICQGQIDVYAQRGTYQLIARAIQPIGQGALQLAFRQLHDRLKAEGLFDDAHKKELPKYPRRVVVITSPTGAAVHDFLQVATRRWPFLDILIVPVQVQGEGAASQVARAIKRCGRRNFKFSPEVIIVTRGGGSLEDLWAFNEEVVVRAIHACPVPVISAVGHEVDVSLSDLVADVRALTPSEAGEKLVPDAREVVDNMNSCATRLGRQMEHALVRSHERLEAIANRPALRKPLTIVRQFALRLDAAEAKLTQISRRKFDLTRQRLKHYSEILQLSLKTTLPTARLRIDQLASKACLRQPLEMIESRNQQLDGLRIRMEEALRRKVESERRALELNESKLLAFNPETVLKRGYSLTVDQNGRPVVNCSSVKTGDTIQTWLAKGKVVSRVESVDSDSLLVEHGEEKED